MASLYFNENNHPEMLSVPLKGEYLREFVTLCRDHAVPLQNSSILSPEDRVLQQIQRDVLTDVATALGKVGPHGITLDELRMLIDHLAHVKTQTIDTSTTYMRAQDAAREEFGHERYIEGMRKYMAESASEAILNDYSHCLALQEHKEAEYVSMVTSFYKRRLVDCITECIEPRLPLDETVRLHASSILMRSVIGALVYYSRHKDRNSIVAKTEGEVLFGNGSTPENIGGIMGANRKSIVRIYELDLTKHLDRERLRHVEKAALQLASQNTGIPLPPTPELGR